MKTNPIGSKTLAKHNLNWQKILSARLSAEQHLKPTLEYHQEQIKKLLNQKDIELREIKKLISHLLITREVLELKINEREHFLELMPNAISNMEVDEKLGFESSFKTDRHQIKDERTVIDLLNKLILNCEGMIESYIPQPIFVTKKEAIAQLARQYLEELETFNYF